MVKALVQHKCSQWLLEFAKLRTCRPTLVESMAQPTFSTVVASAQRRVRCWLLVPFMLLTCAIAHGAVTDEWLYTVQQAVADQSEEQREIAARQALLEVLSRVTGLNTIPRNATIAAALARRTGFTVNTFLCALLPQVKSLPMKRWRWKSNFRTTLCWIWCATLSCPFGGPAGP
ncbi:MAG: hypothetical protein CM15mP120_12570 [Pseudomonadota bacterium]|nr:MAG: hypothetical protein CM15mP120_12570 [Pseudomonadota bacterium]